MTKTNVLLRVVDSLIPSRKDESERKMAGQSHPGQSHPHAQITRQSGEERGGMTRHYAISGCLSLCTVMKRAEQRGEGRKDRLVVQGHYVISNTLALLCIL